MPPRTASTGSEKAGPPRQQRRAPRQFNEWGHDYSRDEGDTAKVDGGAILAINRLLLARLDAKFARRFQLADELLAQLHEEHGVTVNDGSK